MQLDFLLVFDDLFGLYGRLSFEKRAILSRWFGGFVVVVGFSVVVVESIGKGEPSGEIVVLG